MITGRTFLIALALVLAAPATASAAALSFAAPESVSTGTSGGRTDEFTVWLKNGTDQEIVPSFSVVLEGSDEEAIDASVKMSGGPKREGRPKPLPAYSVGRYRLYVETSSNASGQIVATAAGIEPASMQLTVKPDLSATRGVNGALLIPLGIASIVFFGAWGLARKCGALGILDPIGSVKFDFSKSFASTLTAVGALLGTIIAAGVLPEATEKLSKEGFTGLNLTFALAIVFAGLVAAVWQKKVDDEGKEWALVSYVLPFLIATWITLWAVYGELYTLFLLLGELGEGEGFTSTAVWVARGMLILAGFAMASYTYFKLDAALSHKPAATATAEEPGQAGKQKRYGLIRPLDSEDQESLRPVSLL
jgi:hypothetical protein